MFILYPGISVKINFYFIPSKYVPPVKNLKIFSFSIRRKVDSILSFKTEVWNFETKIRKMYLNV